MNALWKLRVLLAQMLQLCRGGFPSPASHSPFSALALKTFKNAPLLLGYKATGESDDFLLHEAGVLAMSPEIGSEDNGFWQRSVNGVGEQRGDRLEIDEFWATTSAALFFSSADSASAEEEAELIAMAVARSQGVALKAGAEFCVFFSEARRAQQPSESLWRPKRNSAATKLSDEWFVSDVAITNR